MVAVTVVILLKTITMQWSKMIKHFTTAFDMPSRVYVISRQYETVCSAYHNTLFVISCYMYCLYQDYAHGAGFDVNFNHILPGS